ncbi:hypothetical protein BOX15_Mlig034128g1, partial [Macrostomum lignano]
HCKVKMSAPAAAPPAGPAGGTPGGPPAGNAEEEGGAPKPTYTQNRRLMQTQAQVEEVVDIMRVNVDKVLERDAKISNLDDRADDDHHGRGRRSNHNHHNHCCPEVKPDCHLFNQDRMLAERNRTNFT